MESPHEHGMRTDPNYRRFIEEQSERLKTMCPCCGQQLPQSKPVQEAKMVIYGVGRQSGRSFLLEKMKQQEIERRNKR